MSTPTRTLTELLNLNTYQGMSDEEIEMVFEHKINLALSSQEVITRTQALIQRNETLIQNAQAASQWSRNLIQSIVETEFPDIEFAAPQQVTPISIVGV